MTKARYTKKEVISAVSTSLNIDPSTIDLDKRKAVYFWLGKFGYLLGGDKGSAIGTITLRSSLKEFVDNAKEQVMALESKTGSKLVDLLATCDQEATLTQKQAQSQILRADNFNEALLPKMRPINGEEFKLLMLDRLKVSQNVMSKILGVSPRKIRMMVADDVAITGSDLIVLNMLNVNGLTWFINGMSKATDGQGMAIKNAAYRVLNGYISIRHTKEATSEFKAVIDELRSALGMGADEAEQSDYITNKALTDTAFNHGLKMIEAAKESGASKKVIEALIEANESLVRFK